MHGAEYAIDYTAFTRAILRVGTCRNYRERAPRVAAKNVESYRAARLGLLFGDLRMYIGYYNSHYLCHVDSSCCHCGLIHHAGFEILVFHLNVWLATSAAPDR